MLLDFHIQVRRFKNIFLGNSLVVQRLGLQALTVKGQVHDLIELKSPKLGSAVKKIKTNKKSFYIPLSIVALQT